MDVTNPARVVKEFTEIAAVLFVPAFLLLGFGHWIDPESLDLPVTLVVAAVLSAIVGVSLGRDRGERVLFTACCAIFFVGTVLGAVYYEAPPLPSGLDILIPPIATGLMAAGVYLALKGRLAAGNSDGPYESAAYAPISPEIGDVTWSSPLQARPAIAEGAHRLILAALPTSLASLMINAQVMEGEDGWSSVVLVVGCAAFFAFLWYVRPRKRCGQVGRDGAAMFDLSWPSRQTVALFANATKLRIRYDRAFAGTHQEYRGTKFRYELCCERAEVLLAIAGVIEESNILAPPFNPTPGLEPPMFLFAERVETAWRERRGLPSSSDHVVGEWLEC